MRKGRDGEKKMGKNNEVVASRPPEGQPTETLTACAKITFV